MPASDACRLTAGPLLDPSRCTNSEYTSWLHKVNTDYMRFIKARNQLDESHVEEYEERLMDQGLLLPSRQGQRKPPADNIYATVAAEFQEKQRGKK